MNYKHYELHDVGEDDVFFLKEASLVKQSVARRCSLLVEWTNK